MEFDAFISALTESAIPFLLVSQTDVESDEKHSVDVSLFILFSSFEVLRYLQLPMADYLTCVIMYALITFYSNA